MASLDRAATPGRQHAGRRIFAEARRELLLPTSAVVLPVEMAGYYTAELTVAGMRRFPDPAARLPPSSRPDA